MTDTFEVQGDFAPAESFSTPADHIDHDAGPIEVATETTPEPNGFVELGLAPELVQAVADLGYTQPTAVQLKCIPLAMGANAQGGATSA